MIEQVNIGYYLLTAEEEHRLNRVEVMAIAKGYVLWRRRGCLPGSKSCKAMLKFLNDNKAVQVKK